MKIDNHSQDFPSRHRRTGFTLIEILIVVSILAILMTLLIGGVFVVRERLRVTSAANFLNMVYVASENYRQLDPMKRYPPAMPDLTLAYAPPDQTVSVKKNGDLLMQCDLALPAESPDKTNTDGYYRIQDPWRQPYQYWVDGVADATDTRPTDGAGDQVTETYAPQWNSDNQDNFQYVWSYGSVRSDQKLRSNASRWIYRKQKGD